MRSSARRNSTSKGDERILSGSSSGGLATDETDPYAINGIHFNRDMFINKIIQDYPLSKLMETEKKLIGEISDLGSDMQTLVYENYNKFILATDTIRKMKTDFKEMEDKMSLLSENIANITQSSTKIANNLKDNRQKVAKYSSIHNLLKKLKFLFDLPNTLKHYSEQSNYEEAVRCYLNGLQYVEEFKKFPSLEAIKIDCQNIVDNLKKDLYKDFDDQEKCSQDLTRNVSLLLNLKENPLVLAEKFLENGLPKLQSNLDSLRSANSPNVSLEEFMELSCGLFLSNLSLVIASFSQAFIQTTDIPDESRQDLEDTLKSFTETILKSFLELMEIKLTNEVKDLPNQEMEVRENFLKTLDRLYRRLVAMSTLVPTSSFSQSGINLISKIAHLDAEMSLLKIQDCYEKSVKESGVELRAHPGSSQEILGSILAALVGQMKLGLNKLRDYTHFDYQFSQNSEFRQKVAVVIILEGYVIKCFKYLIEHGQALLENDSSDSLLWLIIAKLYLDIEMGTVTYMVNTVETDYGIKRDKHLKWILTNVSDVTSMLNSTAKRMLEEFVSFQGNQIAKLMEESVLAKNLIISAEPVGPQAQMRNVVDALTKLEKYIESIFPDTDPLTNLKSERSSDSSKRSYSTFSGRSGHSNRPFPTSYDPNMSSNIQKLFSEKVEIFGDIGFQKNEILMAIVKIGLRAMLEIVRMKTFGSGSLHQTQVDVHYLQLYLWKFVNNEGFLHFLLDEIISSCVQRSIEPSQLETTLVEILAEKNAM